MGQFFDYSDGETIFEGYISLGNNLETRKPCVLIGHAWSGPSEHFYQIADSFAEMGYVAIAIDVYGKGVRGELNGDNSHLMNPLLADRALLKKRLLSAFQYAQNHPQVEKEKIIILGHCFGGLCALDLARATPKGLRGAISIHGLLDAPKIQSPAKIESSILVLHGWEDPFVPPEKVLEFAKEMTDKKADWQIHSYGHAKHAFSFVGADIPELGIKYDQNAHSRSLMSINQFLIELFK
jgi:dienelactone hydrolase